MPQVLAEIKVPYSPSNRQGRFAGSKQPEVKGTGASWVWWHIPVILLTQEAEPLPPWVGLHWWLYWWLCRPRGWQWA
uniref:Uncharacterized protein n=1 Tax=Sciurus vulgaris TaxID=55149 RepID=A0A8D2B5S8_SCIVU